jgi:phosphoenolpyruvate phosphomutase / 2-hydroxyethylphosphonate cytidylyltransferase
MREATKSQKSVYIAMSADIVHAGHMNIIELGRQYGDITLGLLTDEAIATYKRVPIMNYEQRFAVVSNIKGVSRVIPQTTLDYRPNLRKLKPDYVVHADDWKTGVMRSARQQVIDTVTEWGGELIEPKYTEGVSSSDIQKKLKLTGVSPQSRIKRLPEILQANKLTRVLEAHDGLSAYIVENAVYKIDGAKPEQFDAVWVSSLTDSLAKGKPDNEIVDRTSRLATINEILDVTTKPLIFDGDTGGHKEHFAYTVKTLERIGVSAIVIEDKKGLKHNSLHTVTSQHTQEDKNVFAEKIRSGIAARNSELFMIIARIESLIITGDQKDALARAETYINAGADAIMIHSKDTTGEDVRIFAKKYTALKNKVPLMVVPTSYSSITEDTLVEWGADIVIYANQLIRSAYPAMEKAAQTILATKKGSEVESFAAPVEEMLRLFHES